MYNIKQLREQRHDLKARGDAIVDAAQREGRRLTSKEDADFNEIMGQLKTLGVEISAVEAEMDRERAGSASVVSSVHGGGEGAAGQRPGRAWGKIGAKYADLFGAPPRSTFRSTDEFFQIIHAGMSDPRLYAGMNEGVPAEGGFAVPEEFASQLLDASLEKEIVRSRAWVTPMTTETKKIAGFDMSDNSGDAPFGGLKLYWMAEAEQLNTEQSKLWLLQLIANKAALFTWASNELIADGMSFEQALMASFSQAAGWGLDVAFLTGNGGGMPLGALNDPALVVISEEGGQTAKTINYTNLTKMFARIAPACLDNSIWVCNSTAIPQLLTLVYPGTTFPVLVQGQGRDGGFTLLTRPVVFTEKVPALGTVGDILLVDFSQYAIGLRREVTIDKSGHAGFLNDQTAYRAIVRVAGQGRWKSSFQPRYGDPMSWCIALATRS